MLIKINKIKNLGLVYQNFKWNNDVPNFRAVNLVYGWNGSGKTTLTRLFEEMHEQSDKDIQFEIENAGGTKFTAGSDYPLPIRIFNQNYIQKNVRVSESNTNSISVLLGQENQEAADQIKDDEIELFGVPGDKDQPGKVRVSTDLEGRVRRAEKASDKAFSDIARTIGAAIAQSGSASRTFRSPDAKREFASLSKKILLEEKDFDLRIQEIKQEMRPEINLIELGKTDEGGVFRNYLDLGSSYLGEAQKLSSTTATSQLLARLSAEPEISEWVEQGIGIHATHKSTNCEYCGNEISEDRVSKLANHFSTEDQNLKREIDSLTEDLREFYATLSNIRIPEKALFYRELHSDHDANALHIEECRSDLLLQIVDLGKFLKEKKQKTTEEITLDLTLDTQPFTQSLVKLNAAVIAHNTKSKDFKSIQDHSIELIKTHFLSSIYDEVTNGEKLLTEQRTELKALGDEIEVLEARISEARAEISSDHHAAELLNQHLRSFLGRDELTFVPEEVEGGSPSEKQPSGYRIMRGTERASHLSEGEKTAIAFTYFVVHLDDGQFDKNNGLVVIDDPVSSLDSSSLYQAFAFLKNAVKECRQVIILTHSFDFLKLLLNWRSGRRRGSTGCYMLKNRSVEGVRSASIDVMDRELEKYESEYHYLFKCLQDLKEQQDGTIASAYPVPNMARKLWETFLMFRVPNGLNSYSKMEKLKEGGTDPQKLDSIYKFTNDQSHITGSGFDPSLVQEAKKAIENIFELMEELAPEHYRILSASVEP